MNPLIALTDTSAKIRTPLENAKDIEAIQGSKIDRATKQRALDLSYGTKPLTEEEKIKTAITRTAYVAQQLSTFVDKPYTPERDLSYRRTLSGIEQVIGQKMTTLPEKYDQQTISDVFRQGMTVAQNLDEQHKALTQGVDQKKFDYTQQHDTEVLAQQRSEGQLGRDVTMRGQDQSALNQQQDFAQKDRAIEATRINKPLSAQQVSANDAQEMQSLIEQAGPLLSGSTGSGIGANLDAAAGYFGATLPGATNASQLKVIGGAIVAKMPKPPGPASDRDIQLAKEQGAQLGDSSIPIAQRQSALKTLQEINARQVKRANEAGLSITPNESDKSDPMYKDYLKEMGGQ